MWIQSAALTYTGITLLLTVVVLFLTLIVMKWKVRADPYFVDLLRVKERFRS